MSPPTSRRRPDDHRHRRQLDLRRRDDARRQHRLLRYRTDWHRQRRFRHPDNRRGDRAPPATGTSGPGHHPDAAMGSGLDNYISPTPTDAHRRAGQPHRHRQRRSLDLRRWNDARRHHRILHHRPIDGDVVAPVDLATDATLSGSGNWNVGTWSITPSAASGADAATTISPTPTGRSPSRGRPDCHRRRRQLHLRRWHHARRQHRLLHHRPGYRRHRLLG